MALGAPLVLAQSFPQQASRSSCRFRLGAAQTSSHAPSASSSAKVSVDPSLSRSRRGRRYDRHGPGGQAAPDGYTLFIGTPSTHGTNVAVYPKLPYDAIKDFAPIGLIATSPLLLIASPSSTSPRRRSDQVRHASPASWPMVPSVPAASIIWRSSCFSRWRHQDQPYSISRFCAGDDRSHRRANSVQHGRSGGADVHSGWHRQISGRRRQEAVGLLSRTSRRSRNRAFQATKSLTWFGLFAPAGTPGAVVKLLNGKLNEALPSIRQGHFTSWASIRPAARQRCCPRPSRKKSRNG